MNPVIAFAAKHVPFRPVEFTWFDFTNLRESHGKMFELFRQSPVVDFVDKGLVENVPMPFERIACVMKTEGADFFPVTIERSGSRMVFAFWAKDMKHPASICTYDDYVNGELLMTFDETFEMRMISQGHNNYKTTHKKTVEILLWSIIGISMGAANEEVRTAHRCIPNPKNHQRIKRGKSPLFEWETVVIRPPENKTSVFLGGTHASPKPHDRRGHQRRLKSGKVIYIRSMTINKHKIPQEGFIHHDYKVTA